MAEAAVVKNSEQEQNHTAPDDAPNRRGSTGGFDGFAQRKDERDAGNEYKEGKDQIVKVEPFPVLVVQLLGHHAGDVVVADLIQAVDEVFGADDPKHVESAQCID